jgi:hypothetical protein
MGSASTLHLPFGDHIHQFDAGQQDSGTAKGLEPQHGPSAPLDRPMTRVNREVYARFCERLRVKLPGSTHPYIRVKGEWRYLYLVVEKDGNTNDFLLRAHRDKTAAHGTTRTAESSKKTLNLAVARVLKRRHSPLGVSLTCVRWYVAYARH